MILLSQAGGAVYVLLVRIILGICARLFICSRAYVGSLVVFGVLLTQFPVRSAIRNCGIVVITVDCANTHMTSACPSGEQSLAER